MNLDLYKVCKKFTQNFLPLGDQGEKIDFSKSSPNWLNFFGALV
jgi:hypothetical protein